jgi:hypothetical protein
VFYLFEAKCVVVKIIHIKSLILHYPNNHIPFFVDIFFYPFLRKLDLLAEKTDFDITRLTGQPHPNLVQPDRFAHTSSAVCTSHQPHRA